MVGEHAGHRQRMRARFRQQGLEGFAPHEVLELILFHAIPQRNVNPLAHRLIDRFGSLNAVLEAAPEELEAVEGVGECAATLLSLFWHVNRMYQRGLNAQREKLLTPMDMRRHCLRLLEGLKEEHFYVVCVDAQTRVIRDVLVAKGTIDEVTAYPRTVAQIVLAHNAHAVILCHNHPGGTLMPSHADLSVTKQLGTMLEAINVKLMDHVLVAAGHTLSMVDCGLIVHELVDGCVRSRVADAGDEIMVRHLVERKLGKQK